jgi:hypothetical protein
MRVFYERAFKWAIVRNPFDWLMSIYHYRTGRNNPIFHLKRYKFERFAIEYCAQRQVLNADLDASANHLLTGIEYVHPRHKLDLVAKTETLQHDWEAFKNNVGIKAELGRENSSKRPDGFRDHYSDAARAAVEREFADDLRLFGYRF